MYEKSLKGSFFGTLKWLKTFKGKLDQLIIRDFKYQNRKYGIFIIFEQLIREFFSLTGFKGRQYKANVQLGHPRSGHSTITFRDIGTKFPLGCMRFADTLYSVVFIHFRRILMMRMRIQSDGNLS